MRWWPVGAALLVGVVLVAAVALSRDRDTGNAAGVSTVTTGDAGGTTVPSGDALPGAAPPEEPTPEDVESRVDPDSATSIVNVDLVVTRLKVVDPLPLCDDMVTTAQISDAVGGVSLITMSNDGAQPCFYLSDDREVAVSVGTQSPLYDLSEIGIEDPATSIGPADLEGNTRYAFLDEETGSCHVFVVVNDVYLPTFLDVVVDAPGDTCVIADALLAQAFAALPDA